MNGVKNKYKRSFFYFLNSKTPIYIINDDCI